MKQNLSDIRQKLEQLLRSHVPPLRVKVDSPGNFEVTGTKETMQGKQKVDGFYFASVVTKPTDIRFYFFPVYTHVSVFPDLSPALRKCLKGKSCFHFKTLDEEMEREIGGLIRNGVDLYRQEGLI